MAYQSSDGNWADNEIQLKGRNFHTMVFGFEAYKLACGAPDAKLQRTTRRPSFINPKYWFNDYSDPKWQVLLSDPHPNLEGKSYYPPVNMDHCANKGLKEEDFDLIQKRTEGYISSLTSGA